MCERPRVTAVRPVAVLRLAPVALAVAGPILWAASTGDWAPLLVAAAKTIGVLVAFHLALILVVRLATRRAAPTTRRPVRAPLRTRPHTVTRPAPIPVEVTVLDQGSRALDPAHRALPAPVTRTARGVGQDGSILRATDDRLRRQR